MAPAAVTVAESHYEPGALLRVWRRCGFTDAGRTLHGEPVFARPV